MYSGVECFKEFVPENRCKQNYDGNNLKELYKSENYKNVLDLGCGTGSSIDFFKDLSQDIKWTGVDIEDSEEVSRRKRTDGEFHTFDGINLPFDDNFFQVIYCHQVLEHVLEPELLLKDTYRVLRNGGYFIGSTSQLEAFHGYSTFNYTPYGLKYILGKAGFKIKEITPGIDFLTLLISRFLGRVPLLSLYFKRCFLKQSPINTLISFLGKLSGKSNRDINLIKLLFCGQICFVAVKEK